MLRFSRRALGMWFALLLTACVPMASNLTATTDYDHSYDFSRIHKIAIQPVPRDTLATMLMSDDLISRINQSLHAELLRRCFQVVPTNAEADIFLSWKWVPPERD